MGQIEPQGAYFGVCRSRAAYFFEFVGFVVWAKLDPHGAYFLSLAVCLSQIRPSGGIYLELVGLRRPIFLSLSVSWSGPN